ncbi:hypothetical protein CSUB01_11286 [Colletotrichum sublineola]|uniref:MYND-type domain-containing protein n=1 Tax=Colletotrichum sublineola TaxID=1173701 RepID=A0A066X3G7_COLSU|nr:hypothetical protein CSUB01_11286 [Colletotrichum sublineola]
MDDRRTCTIYGSSGARLCTGYASAAYCSLECQQTDWRPHRLLCKHFRRMGPRPSPSHCLIIYFPMEVSRPTLAWVDASLAEGEDSHYLPVLDHLLTVPVNDRYIIGRGVQVVQGNLLRGRPTNPCTLHVYFLDDLDIRGLVTNKALHGTLPTLLGDTWGETIWKGPVVAMLRNGPGCGTLYDRWGGLAHPPFPAGDAGAVRHPTVYNQDAPNCRVVPGRPQPGPLAVLNAKLQEESARLRVAKAVGQRRHRQTTLPPVRTHHSVFAKHIGGIDRVVTL